MTKFFNEGKFSNVPILLKSDEASVFTDATKLFKTMQNLDFSHRIQKNFIPAEVNAAPMENVKSNNTGSSFQTITIMAALTFIIGVTVGLKISDISNIEKTIVKYPESKKKIAENQSVSGTFANPSISEDNASIQASKPDSQNISIQGRYLIKIGTFEETTADSLTSKLNNNSKLLQIKPSQCMGIDETIPNRYIAFRTRAGSSGQNVFLGCFQKKWQAQNALKAVRESHISGTGTAQIYEIE